MRTNIDIDDELLARAMQGGSFATKKETVEAGLRLLARQAAYREVLKWRGKLKWEGDESIDWVAANQAEQAELAAPHRVQEPDPRLAASTAPAAAHSTKGQRRARG